MPSRAPGSLGVCSAENRQCQGRPAWQPPCANCGHLGRSSCRCPPDASKHGAPPAQPPCSVQLLQDRFDRLTPIGTSLRPDWNQPLQLSMWLLSMTLHVASRSTQKERDCQLGSRSSVLPGWRFSARACRGCGARTSRCSVQLGGCDDRETALPAPAVGLLGLL